MKILLLTALISMPALATEIDGVTSRNDAHNSVNENEVKRQADHFPFSRFFKDEDTYGNTLDVSGEKKHNPRLPSAIKQAEETWKARLEVDIDDINRTLKDAVKYSEEYLVGEGQMPIIQDFIDKADPDRIWLLKGTDRILGNVRAHYITSLLSEGAIDLEESVSLWRLTEEIPLDGDFREIFKMPEIREVESINLGKTLTDDQSLRFLHITKRAKQHWQQMRGLVRLALRR